MLTRRGTLIALCAAATRARAEPAPRRTYLADRFVDSVGVCTHLESPPYGQNLDGVRDRAASLGVRHFRDETRPDNVVANWGRIFSENHIRWHLLVSPATNSVADMLEFVRALGAEAVSAIEGQNEGDSPWFRAQAAARGGWSKAVIRYQREVFRALRAESGLRAIPIVSPTVLDYLPGDMRLLRPASLFCDIVAIHAYLQGKQEPETDDPYAGIAWYLRNMRDPFKPSAPVMVTETGYATGTGGIPENAAAVYLPRLLLHLFQSGIERSFLYELMDEGHETADPEQNYGLLTPEAAPKPAFHALRLLLAALSDPGPAFIPSPIALTIESGPSDLRLVPFRKRDGQAVLAVWRAARVWDPDGGHERTVSSVPLQLTMPEFARAELLRLADGETWVPTSLRDHHLEFEADARVRLIRLTR